MYMEKLLQEFFSGTFLLVFIPFKWDQNTSGCGNDDIMNFVRYI